MLGGPYELAIAGCGGADADGVAPVAWHILTASILQLPPAAGDVCMLVRSVVGGCSCLLEHDTVHVAIATTIVSAPASLDMYPAILRVHSRFQAAVEAATPPRALSSLPALRHLRISSLRAM